MVIARETINSYRKDLLHAKLTLWWRCYKKNINFVLDKQIKKEKKEDETIWLNPVDNVYLNQLL